MTKATDEPEANDNSIEEAAIDTNSQVDDEAVSEPARLVREIDYTSRANLLLALVLLTILAFVNSLNGRFLYDDVPQIIENQTLGHWDRETLKNVFTHDIWTTFGPQLAKENLDSIYYRPAFTLFLMAGYLVAGNDPESSPLKWHLIVLLLHLVSVFLCFLVLEKSLILSSGMDEKKRRLITAFGAAFFAVHPLQSESVAWISGLVNPLCAIIMFAAFYCYLNYRETKRIGVFVTGVILFSVSALTKESAVMLVPIVIVYELFVLNRDSAWGVKFRRAIIGALPFACVLIAYLALRYAMLGLIVGRPANGNFPDDNSLTLVDNLRTIPALLCYYMKLVLIPFNLSLLYDFGYTRSLGLSGFWLPLIVVIAVVVGLVQACRRIPEAAVAVIWITIPLLPHLNTRAFISEELIHDRYLYVSMMGFGLLAALLLSRMAEITLFRLKSDSLAKLGSLIVAVLCLLTAVQNKHWQDAETMWRQAARNAPNTRRAQFALGLMAEMKGDVQAALQHYDAALQIQPDMIDALNSSGLVLGRARQWKEATRRFERIVELTPDKAIARFNLAFAYAAQGRFAEAMREQSTAISLDPDGPRADEWRNMLAQLEKLSADQSAQPENKN